MNQQINLYQDILIEKTAPFQLSAALKLVVLIGVLAGCFAGYCYWQVKDSSQKLLAVQQVEREKQDKVSELELKFPERTADPLLIEKIAHQEKQLAGQKDAVLYFADQPRSGNELIFSSLHGLAQVQVKGLWLTRVLLGAEGKQVTLSGMTINELTIPDFVRSLGDRHVFGGVIFDNLTMTRSQESDRLVSFTLNAEGNGQ